MTASSKPTEGASLQSGALELQKKIQGQVIVPGDPVYDEARLAWNRSVQHHPALIVVAETAVDVQKAVVFAGEQGLGVAVQGTGHGNVRPADDGLLILTREMNEVEVDGPAQIARVGAGVEWGKVLAAAQDHGLGSDGPKPLLLTEVRHAGGAIQRKAADSAVYGNRDAQLLLFLVGVTPTAEAHQHLVAYAAELKATLRPSLTGGVYMNFIEGTESQQRIRDGLAPGGYERLARLKAEVDPGSRFRYSFNVTPAE